VQEPGERLLRRRHGRHRDLDFAALLLQAAHEAGLAVTPEAID
jgi:isopenicillin N synthase-like dioxygenase